jgi:hypothetical protein
LYLPESTHRLPVDKLAQVFNNTAASYKFYWFYSILRDIRLHDRREIPVSDILARMISSSWFTINFYRISFGKNDSLHRIVSEIKGQTDLHLKSTEHQVYQTILKAIQTGDRRIVEEVKILSYNVPYRFLTPFFGDALKGLRDQKKNRKIVEEAAVHYHNDNDFPVYRFVIEKNNIELHPLWFTYFKQHLKILEDFCLWNLLHFLQKRNPNVPNIAAKLFPPPKRNSLTKADNFWKLAFMESPDLSTCIFSGNSLLSDPYEIDHFIPWSFVAHDQLWNLIPIAAAVNSSKSNSLPDLHQYFSRFAENQHTAFKIAFEKEKRSWLEDYTTLLKKELVDINYMQRDQFERLLYEHIAPLEQIASNCGFSGGWSYGVTKS